MSEHDSDPHSSNGMLQTMSLKGMVTQTAKLMDIKQWFASVIQPDFTTLEAQVRLGSNREGETGGYTPVPRLEKVTRDMWNLDKQVNVDPKQKEGSSNLLPTEPGGYALMEPPRKSLYQRWFSPMATSGVRSTTIGLVASALGSGCLALPYAFAQTGVGLGLVTLFVSMMVSALSLQVLMLGARYSGCISYAQVLELAMGTTLGSNALDVIMMFNGMGAVIACLIFQGDFLPAILKAPPAALGLSGIAISRQAAVTGACVAVWPLCVPDNIAALRYVGIAVPIALITVTAVVVMDMPEMHAETLSEGIELQWWRFDNPLGWLKATAIFLNACTNQQNAVQCADNLGNPSVKRICKTTLNSAYLCGILYAILGVAGYLSFLGGTKGDFLLDYPLGRTELWIIRVMLSVIVYVATPASLLPSAKSAAQLIARAMGYGNMRIQGVAHAVSATIFLCVCFLMALVVSDVATLLNIVGGILATPIMFIFPCIIYWKLLWPVQSKIFRWPVFLSMAFFGACGLTSVFLNEIIMRM